jgi:hypothetical protein
MRSMKLCYVFANLAFVYTRISMFDFVVDKTVSEPNITLNFVAEDPFLQYVSSLRILTYY